jgi:hypothetical protein
MKKTRQIAKRRDVAALVATIHSVTPGYVRKVINGERSNAAIIATYTGIIEQDKKLFKAFKGNVAV